MSVPTQKVMPRSIRICAGECGRWTRPSDLRFEKAPHTVPRWKGGMCAVCYRTAHGLPRDGRNEPRLIVSAAKGRPDPIRPCAGGCGRNTRPSGISVKDAPDTVARCKNDMCKSCVCRTEGIKQPSRQNRRQAATEETIERYRHSLESWLQGWRARHERAIRRDHTTASGYLQKGQRRQVVLQHQSR